MPQTPQQSQTPIPGTMTDDLGPLVKITDEGERGPVTVRGASVASVEMIRRVLEDSDEPAQSKH